MTQNGRLVDTVAGTQVVQTSSGSIIWVAGAAIDGDGGEDVDHDKCWQPQTSLKLNGRSIDAQSVPYVVIPGIVARQIAGVVLGCRALVEDLRSDLAVSGVVADIGPDDKIGEMSCEMARRLGVPSSPVSGGESQRMLVYRIWPGNAASVDGVDYDLQPLRS